MVNYTLSHHINLFVTHHQHLKPLTHPMPMKHNGQSNATRGVGELEGSNRKKDRGHKVCPLLFFLLLIILLTLTTSSMLPICFPSHLHSHICKNDHLGAHSCKCILSRPCICRNKPSRDRPCKQDRPFPHYCDNN